MCGAAPLASNDRPRPSPSGDVPRKGQCATSGGVQGYTVYGKRYGVHVQVSILTRYCGLINSPADRFVSGRCPPPWAALTRHGWLGSISVLKRRRSLSFRLRDAEEGGTKVTRRRRVILSARHTKKTPSAHSYSCRTELLSGHLDATTLCQNTPRVDPSPCISNLHQVFRK